MSELAGWDSLDDPVQKRELLRKLFDDPTLFPDSLKNWIPNWLGTQPPQYTIDQIPGFQQYTSVQNLAQATVTTSSTAYNTQLGGPAITGLSNGTYTVNYGCAALTNTAGIRAKINIGINGAPPDDTATAQAYTWSTAAVSIGSQATVTLTSGSQSNTITVYYAVGTGAAATGTFDQRYLSATRIN